MRRIFVALTLLLVSSVAAMAQMGPGMMPGGMMDRDKSPDMMGQGMMSGGMMPCMMMGQMSDGMMPDHAKGCFGMAGGMMAGKLDMPQMQKALGLTTEQADKLKAIQRPLQKEAIQIGASIKVADLDLADLLSADKMDLGAVEGKLKELESLRTKMTLAHIKVAQEVKKIVSREQLEKFQGMCQGCKAIDQPVPPAPPAAAPQGGGQQQPEHHPAK